MATLTLTDPEAPPGAGGFAHLGFAPAGGRTRMTGAVTRPPLGVQRPLYLDPLLPDLAWVFLVNPTAGLLAGDRLDLQVRAAAGARIHLTTQAATRVHSMPQGSAHQTIRLEALPGALLEHLPDETVLYAGARLRQECDVVVHPGALVISGEVLVPGRAAMGERFRFDRLSYRLTARTPEGLPLYHEAFTLGPGARSPLRLGVLRPGNGEVLGTLLALGCSGAALVGPLREALAPHAVRSGVSALAGDAGVVVKLLAADAAAAQAALRAAWSAARLALVGAPAPESRKY